MSRAVIEKLRPGRSIGLLFIAYLAASFAPARTFKPDLQPRSPVLLEQQTASPQTLSAEVRELKPGSPIDRDLIGGDAHQYQLSLMANQYVKVVVEQIGIDVVVRLFGPDGKLITEVDSPNGTQGPEPVAVITESAGAYRYEVRSLEEKAQPGRYQINVEAIREPTAKDRSSVAAASALAEAERLRAKGTAEALRGALNNYAEALPLLRSSEDRRGEASALNMLGVINSQLGDNQKALEFFDQALPVMREVGDRRAEASVLSNVGMIKWRAGDFRQALDYGGRAVALKRAVGDRRGEAITLSIIGLSHDGLGEFQEALENFSRALEIQRAIGDASDEATTLNNIAATQYKQGDLQKALDTYGRALSLKRAARDLQGEATILDNVGVIFWKSGDNRRALDYYTRALALRRKTGDRNGEAATLQNIGSAHWSANELQDALTYYDQALTLARAVGYRFIEASVLQNVGSVYIKSGESQKALDYLNQALALKRTINDRWGEGVTLSLIGSTYLSQGHPAAALGFFDQALAQHRAVGDRVYEATTLLGAARAARDLGRLKESRASVEAALDIVESTRSAFNSPDLRASFQASVQDYYDFYIDLLMRLHRDAPSAGYDAAALRASERARARGLLEMLAEARADIRQGVDAKLLERERSLQGQLRAGSERLTRLLGGKHSADQEVAARAEVESLLADDEAVESLIRQTSPRYAALTHPRPLTLREIQQSLDEETVLLEYSLGDERSYLWAVTPTSLSSFELPKRAEIEAAARQVYALLVTKSDGLHPEALRELSRTLLGPVADQLGRKRLLVVATGALQYVPFGALPTPEVSPPKGSRGASVPGTGAGASQPIIGTHEVVSLPSASVLSLLGRDASARAAAPKKVAVFADPVFGKDDPRVRAKAIGERAVVNDSATRDAGPDALPSDVVRSAGDLSLSGFERLAVSRREAELITRLVPAGQSLKALDFAASRATATGAELGRYQIVHFATHSLLDNLHPEFSGIVLSLVDERGEPQDGFLRLNEIYNLKLNADLVVLSACQTALGKDVRGEGLVGLTRGFMYAGAPRVVASLWKVSDAATAELMSRFYRHMLNGGMRPAAALRAAQESLRQERQWAAPYYWAGFVIQGEWR